MGRRAAVTILGMVASTILAACSSGSGDAPASPVAPDRSDGFTFAVVGDYPYVPEDVPKFDRLIEAVNGEAPALVLHVGDLGSKVCTDAALNTSLAAIGRFTMPVVYTPGDNEWTDCHESGIDPLQRLSRVRQLFFPSDQSLGRRTVALARQSAEYPENSRLSFGDVTFVAVHQVGSSNGVGRTAESDAEAAARSAAGQAWIHDGFESAASGGSKGIVVFFQADPNFDLYRLGVRNAHTDFLRTLEREAILYRRPVLLVHGDTHVFRVDKALVGSGDGKPIENVTRLENFGERDVHWSRVTVDPTGPELFTFSPGIVGGNVVAQPAPPR
ncbi:MAG TPA: metallophosphoesterase [Acidimicrobiales bacterium]|nr:metallophosphoesterase [Acidimicrobiales bacterium]